MRVKKRKKVSKNRSIYDVYEPSELERSHLTDKDKLIRITDIPERFQVRMRRRRRRREEQLEKEKEGGRGEKRGVRIGKKAVDEERGGREEERKGYTCKYNNIFIISFKTRAIPVQSSEEGELELESDWVYHQAFCSPPISNQPHSQHTQQHRTGSLSNAKSPLAIPKIKETLNFIRNYYFEVPFIATYRREYVEPELDVYDLWKIYYWDEKVCRWILLEVFLVSLSVFFFTSGCSCSKGRKI